MPRKRRDGNAMKQRGITAIPGYRRWRFKPGAGTGMETDHGPCAAGTLAAMDEAAGHAAGTARTGHSHAAAASNLSKQRVNSMNSSVSTAGFPFWIRQASHRLRVCRSLIFRRQGPLTRRQTPCFIAPIATSPFLLPVWAAEASTTSGGLPGNTVLHSLDRYSSCPRLAICQLIAL